MTQGSAGSLRWETSVHEKGVVIVLSGDIDIASAAQLQRILFHPSAEAHVTVDLTDVAYLDSSGLRALLLFEAHRRRSGGSFRLVPSQSVRRVIEIAGAMQILGIE